MAIRDNRSLRRVRLGNVENASHVWPNQTRASLFCEVLAQNSRLTSLYWPSDFDVDGEKAVCDAVSRNYSLIDITLSKSGRLQKLQEEVVDRNKSLAWRLVHPVIVDIVIALAPLKLLNYVILWIIDCLPHLERGLRHILKIRLIGKEKTNPVIFLFRK